MSYVSIAGAALDSWARTVCGSLWRSVHFYALVIFDLNAAFGAVYCWRAWSSREDRDAVLLLGVLLIAAVFYANLLIYSLYTKTRESVVDGRLGGDAKNVVLAATHVAYRVCLIAIGAIGCCFQLIALYRH